MPNPAWGGKTRALVHFLGPIASARLRLYTPAMTLVLDQPLGARPPGWAGVDLQLPADLPSGLYHLMVFLDQDPDHRRSKALSLLVLR
jgi:hypothetical protein